MAEGEVGGVNIGAIKVEMVVGGGEWRGGWGGSESVVWIREGVGGGVVCQGVDEYEVV